MIQASMQLTLLVVVILVAGAICHVPVKLTSLSFPKLEEVKEMRIIMAPEKIDVGSAFSVAYKAGGITVNARLTIEPNKLGKIICDYQIVFADGRKKWYQTTRSDYSSLSSTILQKGVQIRMSLTPVGIQSTGKMTLNAQLPGSAQKLPDLCEIANVPLRGGQMILTANTNELIVKPLKHFKNPMYDTNMRKDQKIVFPVEACRHEIEAFKLRNILHERANDCNLVEEHRKRCNNCIHHHACGKAKAKLGKL